jgi:hypothetical protein
MPAVQQVVSLHRDILEFDGATAISNHNFRQVDALAYAKEGTLQKVLDELYGADH